MSYSTDKFYFAAVLLALGYKMIKVEDINVKKKAFVFAIEQALAEELREGYYNRELQVDARTLVDCIKELKDRIYGS